MGCCCGCNDNKNRKGALLVYLAIFVLIAIVVIIVSCMGGKEIVPETPKTAKERTQLMIDERMNDFDYTNGLQRLYNQQVELIKARALAIQSYKRWQSEWISTNEIARALDAKIQAASKDSSSFTNGVRKALLAEMEALVAKDITGLTLRANIAKANEDLAQHQGKVQTFIQAKISKQAKFGAKADVEDANRFRESREQARQEVLNGRLRRPSSNNESFTTPPARKEGWWTNSAPYKAAAAQAATNNSPKVETKGAK